MIETRVGGQVIVLQQEDINMLSSISSLFYQVSGIIPPIVGQTAMAEEDIACSKIKTLEEYLQEGEAALEEFLKENSAFLGDEPIKPSNGTSLPKALVKALNAFEAADGVYTLSNNLRYHKGLAETNLYCGLCMKSYGYNYIGHLEVAFDSAKKIETSSPLSYARVIYHLGVAYLDNVEKRLQIKIKIAKENLKFGPDEKNSPSSTEERAYLKKYGADLLLQQWQSKNFDGSIYNFSKAFQYSEKFVDDEMKLMGSKGVEAIKSKSREFRSSAQSADRKGLLNNALDYFEEIKKFKVSDDLISKAAQQYRRGKALQQANLIT